MDKQHIKHWFDIAILSIVSIIVIVFSTNAIIRLEKEYKLSKMIKKR